MQFEWTFWNEPDCGPGSRDRDGGGEPRSDHRHRRRDESHEPARARQAVAGSPCRGVSWRGVGANTVLGIIDTGINSRHGAFTPKNDDGTSTRVIGGVDVSCDGAAASDPFCAPGAGRPPDFTPLPGFDAPTNHFHGSFVAAVAAGSGAVERSATGLLVRSIEFWTGATLPDGPDAGMKLIPLIGIAPEANLYIIKVFDHTGLGVPTSIILAGINAAISARVDDGVDIDTINMSLGGATLFDARGLRCGRPSEQLRRRERAGRHAVRREAGPPAIRGSDEGPRLSAHRDGQRLPERRGRPLELADAGEWPSARGQGAAPRRRGRRIWRVLLSDRAGPREVCRQRTRAVPGSLETIRPRDPGAVRPARSTDLRERTRQEPGRQPSQGQPDVRRERGLRRLAEREADDER